MGSKSEIDSLCSPAQNSEIFAALRQDFDELSRVDAENHT